MFLNQFYDKIKPYILDLRAKASLIEFEDTRQEIFCEIDEANQSNNMIYVQCENHYSLVERYPDAPIMLLEYSPSLVVAKCLMYSDDNMPSVEAVRLSMHAYCMLVAWLIGNGKKFSRHKCEVRLDSVDLVKIKGVETFNKRVLNTKFSYWPDEISHTTNIFTVTGFKMLSAKEIVAQFSNT